MAMPIAWSVSNRTDFVNVENQGPVDSCWAFAPVTSLSHEWFLKTGEVVRCSQQQLIDKWQTHCKKIQPICGDELRRVLDYIELIGLVRADDYPYTGWKNLSAEIPLGRRFHIDSYVFIDPYSDLDEVFEILHEHVVIAYSRVYSGLHYLPILAEIHDPQFVFTSYFTHGSRDGENIYHLMVIVGYGVTEDGTYFYELQNSYGPFWADQGYCRMECSLVTPVAYVLLN